MSKKKKTEATFSRLMVELVCNGIPASLYIDASDVHSSESECELCGSHGSMTIDIKCPQCGDYHYFTLKEW